MKPARYRILIVLTPAFRPTAGGVQMSTRKMGQRFAQLGHSVGVFSFANRGHDPCAFGELYQGVESGGCRRQRNLHALRRTLQSFRPDVVINQMPYEHEIGQCLKDEKDFLLLSCLRNTLYSVKGDLQAYVERTAPGPLKRFSGWTPIQQAFLALHKRRQRAELLRILDTYDYFVMFGPPNLQELHYFVPEFERNKVRLIPNSISHVAERAPAKQNRLLWLGRVAHEQKRAELILPIWKRVSRALPDWQLDVVGDGPLLEELQRKVRGQSLPRAHFHGRQVPDEYYNRAAIFFMTSAFEGFPNTLVEAQSLAAIPVVFDSYPVARWIIDDGVNGHLVKPFDVNAMAASIIKLADDPQRKEFAKNALRSAQRFHIDRVGEMWEQLFEESLGPDSN